MQLNLDPLLHRLEKDIFVKYYIIFIIYHNSDYCIYFVINSTTEFISYQTSGIKIKMKRGSGVQYSRYGTVQSVRYSTVGSV